jgi:hypothetical protein
MEKIRVYNPKALLILGGVLCGLFVVGLASAAVIVSLQRQEPPRVVVAPPAGDSKETVPFTWEISPIGEINTILIEDVDVGVDGIEIRGSATGGNAETLFIQELIIEDIKASSFTIGAALSTGSATFHSFTVNGLSCEYDDEQITNDPTASQVNLLPYANGTGDSHSLTNSIVPHIVVADGTSTADGPGKIRTLILRRVTSRGPIIITNIAVNTGDLTNIQAGDGDKAAGAPDCVFGFADGSLVANSSSVTGVIFAAHDFR